MRTYKFMASVAISLLPFTSKAQCKIQTEKGTGLRYIAQNIGPDMLQWNITVGKQNEQYYLGANIVAEGTDTHLLTSSDYLYIDLATGERLMLSPVAGVKPVATTQNGKPAVQYNARYILAKEQLEKLAFTDVDNISATIDGRQRDKPVNKDKQADGLKNAATCMLK